MAESKIISPQLRLAAGPVLEALDSEGQVLESLRLSAQAVRISFDRASQNFHLDPGVHPPETDTHFRQELTINPDLPGNCEGRNPVALGIHEFCFETEAEGARLGGFGVVVITDIVVHDPDIPVDPRSSSRRLRGQRIRPAANSGNEPAQQFVKNAHWDIGGEAAAIYLRYHKKMLSQPDGTTTVRHLIEVHAPYEATSICIRPLPS